MNDDYDERPPNFWGVLIILGAFMLGVAECSRAKADLLPDSVRAEIEHTSHISQHFGPDPTNYGYDAASLVAHWSLGRRFSLEVSEGAVLESCKPSWCGGLWGPREVFQARLGYTIWSRR